MIVKNAKRTNSNKYSIWLSALENYLLFRFRIHVIYGKGESIGYHTNGHQAQEDDFITLDNKRGKETQLYALLHEAGHVILRSDGEVHQRRFPMTERKRKTQGHRVDVLREEVVAWERAKSLANELKIEIHEEKWHRQRSKALMEYIKWAYDPKEYFKP